MTLIPSCIKKPGGILLRRLIRLLAPKFTIGVTGVVCNERGQVYVQKHRFWPNQAWGFPGGFLAKGESAAQGVAREILEETGMRVTHLTLLLSRNPTASHHNFYFVARVVPPVELKLQRLEVIEGRFVAPHELPAPFLSDHREFFEAHRQEVAAFSLEAHHGES